MFSSIHNTLFCFLREERTPLQSFTFLQYYIQYRKQASNTVYTLFSEVDLSKKMHFSLFTLALVAFYSSQLVVGHTVFTTLFVNDVSNGDGTCIRMPSDPSTATFPINDLDSDSMACGKFVVDRNLCVDNANDDRIQRYDGS